jgi:uncharacterized protein YbjT (DUF2867 family)
MADKKIIAVTGATGAQGGGLVRAIMADRSGPFTARAITRDPTSEKAKALAALGAEVVQGDVDDAASLRRAFAGAHGAYCVTFFWAHMKPEQELAEARNLAHAAQQAKVAHVIWSTLEDTRTLVPLSDDRMPTLGGKYKVPHFDAKGEADGIFAEVGVPTTCLVTSFYWDNFIYFGMGPKKGPDGTLAITLPMGDARLAGIAAEDIGKCAYGVFQKGKDLIGRTVGIAGQHLTGAQMAAGFAKATTRSRRRRTEGSASRARTISATCSRSIATSRSRCATRAASTCPARSILSCRRSRSGWTGTRARSRSDSPAHHRTRGRGVGDHHARASASARRSGVPTSSHSCAVTSTA